MDLIRPGGQRFCFVMPFHIREGRGGGAEVQAWLLAKELARRGFEVSYVAQSIEGKAGQQETIDGVTVRWVRYVHRFRWSNGISYYRALSQLQPNVVVQRGASFVTGVAGAWCCLHDAQFIWICSDNTIVEKWTFWRKQIQLNRTHKVDAFKGAVLLFNAILTDLARNWGMRHVTHAFTQNEVQQDKLRESFGMESARMISGHATANGKEPLKPLP